MRDEKSRATGRTLMIIIGNALLFLLFFGRQRKVAKETWPCAAENSLTRWFPWRGQKLALYSGMPGGVLPIALIETDRFVDFYPLKQFAPVIHGNHRVRAASQWAKTLRRKNVFFLCRANVKPEIANYQKY